MFMYMVFYEGSLIRLLNSNEKIAHLRKKKALTIFIASPSDDAHPKTLQNMCGDTWVKYELSVALKKLGHVISNRRPDILIHLFGVPSVSGKPIEKFPNSIFKIVWVYSHPEKVSSTNLRGYDRIYCLSTSYPEKLEKLGYTDARVMLGATSKRPLKVLNKYDIVFVGNRRVLGSREVIDHLKSLGRLPYRIGIWGKDWRGKIPDSWYGGRYYPYLELDKLYASSKICLQDHRPEMSREGFVSVKIFDILASGSLAISDRNIGIRGLFKDAIPEYKSAQHLKQLLHHYINDPKERLRLIKLGQKIAFACTWDKRAAQFMDGLHG